MRVWIGLYVAIISIVVVALEGSFLVRFVTRFAEEIFAILISIIFIYEVVKKLVDVSKSPSHFYAFVFIEYKKRKVFSLTSRHQLGD